MNTRTHLPESCYSQSLCQSIQVDKNKLTFGLAIPVFCEYFEDVGVLLHELVIDGPEACEILATARRYVFPEMESKHVAVKSVGMKFLILPLAI